MADLSKDNDTPSLEAALDNPSKQKITVPLKDRLSLSPEEASALTGIGLTSIKMATYSDSLIARKHGRNTVILPSDLKAWLEAMPMVGKNPEA